MIMYNHTYIVLYEDPATKVTQWLELISSHTWYTKYTFSTSRRLCSYSQRQAMSVTMGLGRWTTGKTFCSTPVKRAADGDPSAGQHHLAWVTIEVGLVPDTPTWINSTGITTFDFSFGSQFGPQYDVRFLVWATL
jgi:hypothetical protein